MGRTSLRSAGRIALTPKRRSVHATLLLGTPLPCPPARPRRSCRPMTDQPLEHATNHADQKPTDHGRVDQPPTDQPTTSAPVPIEEAAAALGITVNAVRQRLKRGTLTGIKTDAGW